MRMTPVTSDSLWRTRGNMRKAQHWRLCENFCRDVVSGDDHVEELDAVQEACRLLPQGLLGRQAIEVVEQFERPLLGQDDHRPARPKAGPLGAEAAQPSLIGIMEPAEVGHLGDGQGISDELALAILVDDLRDKNSRRQDPEVEEDVQIILY